MEHDLEVGWGVGGSEGTQKILEEVNISDKPLKMNELLLCWQETFIFQGLGCKWLWEP